MKTEFKNNKLEISFGEKIDSNKMSIRLSQGTWNVTLFSLFEDNQITENSFPSEAGIYSLVINYANELLYSEILLYKTNPKFEKLSFKFYQECERIFCSINSEIALELNKEIVLNKIDGNVKELLKNIK